MGRNKINLNDYVSIAPTYGFQRESFRPLQSTSHISETYHIVADLLDEICILQTCFRQDLAAHVIQEQDGLLIHVLHQNEDISTDWDDDYSTEYNESEDEEGEERPLAIFRVKLDTVHGDLSVSPLETSLLEERPGDQKDAYILALNKAANWYRGTAKLHETAISQRAVPEAMRDMINPTDISRKLEILDAINNPTARREYIIDVTGAEGIGYIQVAETYQGHYHQEIVRDHGRATNVPFGDSEFCIAAINYRALHGVKNSLNDVLCIFLNHLAAESSVKEIKRCVATVEDNGMTMVTMYDSADAFEDTESIVGMVCFKFGKTAAYAKVLINNTGHKDQDVMQAVGAFAYGTYFEFATEPGGLEG